MREGVFLFLPQNTKHKTAPAGREDSFLLFARGYPRVSTSHHTQGRSNHYHITRGTRLGSSDSIF